MLTALCDVMAKCYEKGLITTRDGNAAVSRGDCFYITPSGTRKGVLRVEDIIKYKLNKLTGELTSESDVSPKPSIELEMHRLIHKNKNSEYMATLHVHPTNVVAALISGFDLQKIHNIFPELNRYTQVGPTVDIFYPGDPKLSAMTEVCMYKPDLTLYDIVGQQGHGVFIQANNPWDCYEHLERLEHACEMILKSRLQPKDLE